MVKNGKIERCCCLGQEELRLSWTDARTAVTIYKDVYRQEPVRIGIISRKNMDATPGHKQDGQAKAYRPQAGPE
jgi:hypothetical protein